MNTAAQQPWCSRKEACEILGVDKNRFYELVRAGLLTLRAFPTYRRKRVVSRVEVLRVMAMMAV